VRDPSKEIKTTECFAGSIVSVTLTVGSIVGGTDVGGLVLSAGGTGWQEIAVRRMIRVCVRSRANRLIKFPIRRF
jgi:hypothetical protein